jgi:hypothetical protein
MALWPTHLSQIDRGACFEVPLSSIYMNKFQILDRAVPL